MKEELQLLLALQAQDLEIKALQEAAETLQYKKRDLEATIDQERKRLEQTQHALEQLRKESRLKNAEVDDLDYQIRHYEKQLKESLMNFKEMEALRQQIEHSKTRLETLEEEALAMMDQIGAQEQALKSKEAEFRQFRTELEAEIRHVESEMEKAKAKATGAAQRREQLARQIDKHLFERYERLRQKLEMPVATIKGRSCGGCKLSLSETAIERARVGLELVICENCSRILVSL